MAKKPFNSLHGDIENVRDTSTLCNRINRDLNEAGLMTDLDVSSLIESLATLIVDASAALRQCVYIASCQSMRGK